MAKGTYWPTETNDRTASFVIKEGVEVYGRVSPAGKTVEERDWRRHRTVSSGGIGRRDYALDNSLHVVTGADRAVLDGFVITERTASTLSRAQGGLRPEAPGCRSKGKELVRAGGSPIHITPEIIFEENAAQGDGGGAAFTDHSIARLEQCEISRNRAGRNGGGIAVMGGSQVIRTNTRSWGHSARGQGNDLFLDLGPPK